MTLLRSLFDTTIGPHASEPRPRPIHVLQVSIDSTVLNTGGEPEALSRQRRYAEELLNQAPESSITTIVVMHSWRIDRSKAHQVSAASTGACRFELVSAPRVIAPILVALRIFSLHLRHRIDVVTTQRVLDEGWGAALAARVLGIPSIGQIHFDLFAEGAVIEMVGTSFIRKVRYSLMLRGLRLFSQLRVDGARPGRTIIERKLHTQVFQMPVPTPLLSAGDQKQEDRRLGAALGERVLFVGRLVRQKRIDRWLRVAALVKEQLPDAQFDLVGDGPLRAELEQLSEQLGLSRNVTFHGDIQNSGLAPFFLSARAFLLTSDYEGLPRVILEAISFGVPVVSTEIGGVEDVITDSITGFIGKTEAELASGVIKLLEDRSTAEAIGKQLMESARAQFGFEPLMRLWIQKLRALAA